MENQELTKEVVFLELMTFSVNEKPLKSTNHFYIKFKKGNQTEHNFQRKLSLLVRDIQDEEFSKAILGKDFQFICTCNEGYYVAKTIEGMEKGINFYEKKGGKWEFLNAMKTAYLIKKKEIEEIAECEESGQYLLKLVI